MSVFGSGGVANASVFSCGEFGQEAVVPLPDGRRIPVAARPHSPLVREALVQARAALRTASADTPEDLAKPERASVLERRIALVTQALAQISE